MGDVQKFVKRPIAVEAVQFHGSTTQAAALKRWMGGDEYQHPSICTQDVRALSVPTKFGRTWANPGDWIVKNPVDDEFYPVAAADFAQLYEPEFTDPIIDLMKPELPMWLSDRLTAVVAKQQGVLDLLAETD